MSQAQLVARPLGRQALSDVLTENRETYDRLAVQYSRTGPARLVQAQRWLRPVLAPLRRARRPLSVLELGSADGYLTGYLTSLGHEVTAVEFAPGMAASTRRHAPYARVIEADFLDVQLEGGYDVILCSAFAHLFPPPWDRTVLRKVAGSLGPDGRGYIATTVHAMSSAGYEEKGDGLRRYRRRYTSAEFEHVMKCSGMVPERFYVTRDRLAPGKTWGNWIARGGAA